MNDDRQEAEYVPAEDLVVRRIYRPQARNMKLGIWTGTAFLGVRRKLGLVFLDEEFHCDEEAWGTAKPLGLFPGHIGEGPELTADDPALLDLMLGFQTCGSSPNDSHHPDQAVEARSRGMTRRVSEFGSLGDRTNRSTPEVPAPGRAAPAQQQHGNVAIEPAVADRLGRAGARCRRRRPSQDWTEPTPTALAIVLRNRAPRGIHC